MFTLECPEAEGTMTEERGECVVSSHVTFVRPSPQLRSLFCRFRTRVIFSFRHRVTDGLTDRARTTMGKKEYKDTFFVWSMLILGDLLSML